MSESEFVTISGIVEEGGIKLSWSTEVRSNVFNSEAAVKDCFSGIVEHVKMELRRSRAMAAHPELTKRR